jgi:hypothetical protein
MCFIVFPSQFLVKQLVSESIFFNTVLKVPWGQGWIQHVPALVFTLNTFKPKFIIQF